MALSKEDKADVKGAMGKAIANKVSNVTKDSKTPQDNEDAAEKKMLGRLKAKSKAIRNTRKFLG